MYCPPPPAPETTACFQQGVSHGYAVEFAFAGALTRVILELAWLLTLGIAWWVLFGAVLYANLARPAAAVLDRLAVVSDPGHIHLRDTTEERF